jgi:hypothetical protein
MDRFDEDTARSGAERVDNARTGTSRTEGRFRDAELGEQLRRLEVPEHAPDFFATLEEELEAEVEAGSRSAARVSDGLSSGRRPSRQSASSRAPDQPVRQKRRSWLRYAWIPIPVALAILLLLWAFAGPLGIDSFEPQPASAAEITQQAVAALSDAEALRGTVVVVQPGAGGADAGDVGTEGAGTVPSSGDTGAGDVETGRDEMRWTFISTAEGDFRWTGIDRTEDLAYDHRTGVQQSFSIDGELVFASERSGLAAGLPDPGPAENLLERQIGSVVRALLESPDAAVQEVTYDGRPAWTLSTDVRPNLIVDTSANHMEVTIDQATGFPVRIVETRDGSFVQETRLEDLEIDPVLAEDAFLVEFPPDVEVIRTDHGFRRFAEAELAGEVAALVGYMPLLPAEVPAGFVLTSVTAAAEGSSTGVEGMNPPTPGVVSVLYRRGFDRLLVSTRTVGADPSLWGDPLATGEGFIDTPETVTLASGAFAGIAAEILVDMRAIPHIWAMSDALVVTVSGDLTRDELLAAAESLAPIE